MPSVYRRILVPLDSDKQQEPALDYARTLAQSTVASVLLAWLVPVLASEERFFSQIQVEPGSSGARRKEQGEAFLARAVQRFREYRVKEKRPSTAWSTASEGKVYEAVVRGNPSSPGFQARFRDGLSTGALGASRGRWPGPQASISVRPEVAPLW